MTITERKSTEIESKIATSINLESSSDEDDVSNASDNSDTLPPVVSNTSVNAEDVVEAVSDMILTALNGADDDDDDTKSRWVRARAVATTSTTATDRRTRTSAHNAMRHASENITTDVYDRYETRSHLEESLARRIHNKKREYTRSSRTSHSSEEKKRSGSGSGSGSGSDLVDSTEQKNGGATTTGEEKKTFVEEASANDNDDDEKSDKDSVTRDAKEKEKKETKEKKIDDDDDVTDDGGTLLFFEDKKNGNKTFEKNAKDFLDQKFINEHCKCSICFSIFRDAVILKCHGDNERVSADKECSCGDSSDSDADGCGSSYHKEHKQCNHVFCDKCIKSAMKSSARKCPICKQRIDKISDMTMRRLISDLKVKCSNADRGCPWKGVLGKKFNDVVNHEKSCPLRGQECKDCKEMILWADSATHADKVCKKKAIVCEGGCAVMVSRENMKKHLATECRLRKERCKYVDEMCHYLLVLEDASSSSSSDADAKLVAAASDNCKKCSTKMSMTDLETHYTEMMSQHLESMKKLHDDAKLNLSISNDERSQLLADKDFTSKYVWNVDRKRLYKKNDIQQSPVFHIGNHNWQLSMMKQAVNFTFDASPSSSSSAVMDTVNDEKSSTSSSVSASEALKKKKSKPTVREAICLSLVLEKQAMPCIGIITISFNREKKWCDKQTIAYKLCNSHRIVIPLDDFKSHFSDDSSYLKIEFMIDRPFKPIVHTDGNPIKIVTTSGAGAGISGDVDGDYAPRRRRYGMSGGAHARQRSIDDSPYGTEFPVGGLRMRGLGSSSYSDSSSTLSSSSCSDATSSDSDSGSDNYFDDIRIIPRLARELS